MMTCIRSLRPVLPGVLAALLAFPVAARASYVAFRCTSADETVFLQGGHIPGRIVLTPRGGNGKPVQGPVTLESSELQVERHESALLSRDLGGCCGDGLGMVTSQTRTRELFVIRRRDGAPFPAGLEGLADDRRRLELPLLCRTEANGMGMCQLACSQDAPDQPD